LRIGYGHKIIKYKDKKLLIMNALGRVFMNNKFLSCPFKKIEKKVTRSHQKALLVTTVNL
ncbi:MAG: YmdB family metallophosphoesterase, partial [Pigeon pea little leaf phytoplasma]|nr:YmdB family metallophosphoesterase [Pigeon pea little leaf phytoplasma]